MIGRYSKTCPYCGKEFTTDVEHKKYCSEAHKTYDYRRRRLEQATEKICPKCGRPWTEPEISKNHTKPSYCRYCQQYFADHHRQKVQ